MWEPLRMLRKDPGFSAVAIATLALAIGANTAVFSLVDGVILRPLGYRDAARLYDIHEVVPKFAHLAPLIPVNAMHFLEWRKNAHSFDQMALIGGMNLNLTGSGEPERIAAARVSPSLFPMLGVQAQLGRTFADDEDDPGRDDVVVLSNELWQQRFGGDPSMVGRKIQLNSRAYQVIGVLPADFHFPKLSHLFAMTLDDERPLLWKPFALHKDEMDDMGDFNYVCIARLRPGATPGQAKAELNALQAGIASRLKDKVELQAEIVGLQAQITERSRGGLELMLAAVGAVLLIACVNIANLLLARAMGRRREMAVRTALGAGAGRLVRQMLAESVLLAVAGGVLGMAIAWAAVRLLVASAPLDIPRIDEVHPDLRLLAFNFVISTAAGLLFGWLPAWRFARADPLEAMKSGSRGSTAARSSGRVRNLLVGVEVGLSALCLIAGGLLLNSFVRLLRVDKGFDAERVLTVNLNLQGAKYPDLQKRDVFQYAVLERVRSMPGVVSAGVSNQLPLAGEGNNNLVAPEGSNLPVMDRPLSDLRHVNPDYFGTLGIPLRNGRLFQESDRGHLVALVSTVTANRIWPGKDPVGKRFLMGGGTNGPWIEVLGVVGDIHGVSLSRAPSNTIYLPYWQRSYGGISLVLRTSLTAATAAPMLRAAIHDVDPDLPVPAIRTMDALVDASVAQRRFQMTLVLLFAAAALLLASLGIYGVVSYSVGQRTSEMGIRMALGAQPSRIRGLVLWQGLAPVAAGLAAGIAASVALGRLLGTLLFGVRAGDPATIGGVSGLLILVAAAATYIPARRATRVDPAIALRDE
jgi:putative ABC transport system permease protein